MIHTELKSFLHENNIRSADLARFLGLSKTHVYYMTSGRSPIPVYVHIVLSLLPKGQALYFIKGGLKLIHFEPWQTLGITPTSTKAEAKKARQKLAKQLHSDVGGNDESMAIVNAAYDKFCKKNRWD